MYTKQQYLNHEVDHNTYYLDLANYCGLTFMNSLGTDFIQRCKFALDNGDEHLNSIPLKEWDLKVYQLNNTVKRKVKEYDGYGLTLATGVCMLKAIAKQAVEKTYPKVK